MDLITICAAQGRRRPESALKSYTAGGKGPRGHFKAWRRLFIAEKIISGNLISDILNVQLLAGVFPLTAEAAECIFMRGVLIIKKCLTFYSLRYIIKKLSEQGIYMLLNYISAAISYGRFSAAVSDRRFSAAVSDGGLPEWGLRLGGGLYSGVFYQGMRRKAL